MIARLAASSRRQAHSERDLEWQRRASTLGGILTRLVTVTVWFLAILMLLRELSIDVLPILTGAGIAGLAIGFGAQNLVRDVISGFFLILEDQVRVGDMARINGVDRRHRAGQPADDRAARRRRRRPRVSQRHGHGARQPEQAVFKRRSSTCGSPTARISTACSAVDWRSRRVDAGGPRRGRRCCSSPIEIVGVESLADGFAPVRAKFKTQPLNQGMVANELRRRLMTLLAARGITPYMPPATAPAERPEGPYRNP